MSALNPTCCSASRAARTVTLFVPVGNHRKAHWSVPIRDEDGDVVDSGVTACRFCPFCGARLAREHLAFEVDERMWDETQEEYDAAMVHSEQPLLAHAQRLTEFFARMAADGLPEGER